MLDKWLPLREMFYKKLRLLASYFLLDVHYTFRECSEDGTWRKNLTMSMGESDYSKCIQPIDCYKVSNTFQDPHES